MTEYLSLPDEIQEVINEFEDTHNEIEDAVGGITLNGPSVCHGPGR
jgi:hypothetical protein